MENFLQYGAGFEHNNWVRNLILAYFFLLAKQCCCFACCLTKSQSVAFFTKSSKEGLKELKVISVTDIFPVENEVLDNWISETKSSGFFLCLRARLYHVDNLNWERRKVLSWKIHGKGSRSSLALKYSLCSLICIDMLSVEISIIAWDTVSHCEAWWQDVSNEIMKSTLIHKFLSFFIDFFFCEMDVG